MTIRSSAAIVVLGLAIVAAVFVAIQVRGATGSVIDGWPVGDRASCPDPRCDEAIRVATDALDAGHPGHPTVVDATLYDYDGFQTTTIPFSIVVFRFDDGTTRAVGVGYAFGTGQFRPFARESP